jgi:hypothetical protein
MSDEIGGETPDHEWLRSLPLHHSLHGEAARRFDKDAIAWRGTKEDREAIEDFLVSRYGREDHLPSFVWRLLATATTAPPEYWELCDSCNGRGVDPFSGKSCAACRRAGYTVPTPERPGGRPRRNGHS